MPPAVLTTPRVLTLADHGARMTLDEFEHIEVTEGLRAELSQGAIQMSGVPDIEHFKTEETVRDPLIVHKLQNPTRV
jgi:hypothetical protein